MENDSITILIKPERWKITLLQFQSKLKKILKMILLKDQFFF